MSKLMENKKGSLISIIIPVFDVAPYIEKCVRSVMAQSYRELQIILVDDGSTDGSEIICDALAAEDARIIVIHKTNGGLSDARNTGIAASRGRWLMFIDGDDFVDPDMALLLIEKAIETSSDIAICGFSYVTESGERLRDDTPGENVWDEGEFWDALYPKGASERECLSAVWNKIYARALFEGEAFDYGKSFEDAFILHRIIRKCTTISTIPMCCYSYVQRADSIMHTLDGVAMIDGAEAMLERAEYFDEKGNRYAVRRALESALSYLRFGRSRVSSQLELNCWNRFAANVRYRIRGMNYKPSAKLVLFTISPILYCIVGEYKKLFVNHLDKQ